VLPWEDPPERAQDWALAPAVGAAAATHGAHLFDETADDGEKQIQTYQRSNDATQHHLPPSEER
jgi:hypothetical protein